MMELKTISVVEVLKKKYPVIDVRSEVEFEAGHIPWAINLPILNNSERELVGKTYKQQGQDNAIELGHKLISGSIKELRIQKWVSYINENPNCIIQCFRGGLRSKIAQEWCHQSGVKAASEVLRLEGGYKLYRQTVLTEIPEICSHLNLLVISGVTGSGKSILLDRLGNNKIDLEKLANHRGSAFGGKGWQPTQSQFENNLHFDLKNVAVANSKLKQPNYIYVEDESRLIGHVAQPESLFSKIRESPVVILDESIQTRVQNTFDEYVLKSDLLKQDIELGLQVFFNFKTSLKKISKKLGGLRYSEILNDILMSENDYKNNFSLESNRVWIEKLLIHYYDPLYLNSLQKRDPKVIFKGDSAAVFEFLNSSL